MDRKTICEAQAAICGEQAGRGDSDRVFWLAEAQRWRALASEHAHAAISIDGVARIAEAGALDREVQMRDGQPSRQT